MVADKEVLMYFVISLQLLALKLSHLQPLKEREVCRGSQKANGESSLLEMKKWLT